MTTIHTTLSELYARWDDLANIPVRFSSKGVPLIEEPFLHFKKGTATEHVWRWFEQQNPRFIVGEVMQGVRAPDVVAPADLVHLSETGVHAGRRFCMSNGSDGSRSVHAMYAPLSNPTFRSKVCEECLTIWATEAYSEHEPMPGYIVAARAREYGAGKAIQPLALQPQLELQ